MTDTLYADVSEWQVPIDDSYPFRVIAFRSNDGTYRDRNFAQNYEWAKRKCDEGSLEFFIVYFVYRPNWEDTLYTIKDMIGTIHPKMVVMIDVETWGGQMSGDHSDAINRTYWGLTDWIGTSSETGTRRVIGYANRSDLNEMWPTRPEGVALVGAGYGSDPQLPGQISHQYTDGQGYGGGLPEGCPPFNNCDMNSANGLDPLQFSMSCGIGYVPPQDAPAQEGDESVAVTDAQIREIHEQIVNGWPQLGTDDQSRPLTLVDSQAAQNATLQDIKNLLERIEGFQKQLLDAITGKQAS